jgi:hypothetical protein
MHTLTIQARVLFDTEASKNIFRSGFLRGLNQKIILAQHNAMISIVHRIEWFNSHTTNLSLVDGPNPKSFLLSPTVSHLPIPSPLYLSHTDNAVMPEWRRHMVMPERRWPRRTAHIDDHRAWRLRQAATSMTTAAASSDLGRTGYIWVRGVFSGIDFCQRLT